MSRRHFRGSSKVSPITRGYIVVSNHEPFAGLADVERAYVHVDYENEHDIYEEHKPLYEVTQKRSIKERIKAMRFLFKGKDQEKGA